MCDGDDDCQDDSDEDPHYCGKAISIDCVLYVFSHTLDNTGNWKTTEEMSWSNASLLANIIVCVSRGNPV